MTVVFKRSILESDCSPAILWGNILDGSTVSSSTGSGGNLLNESTNTYWTPTALPATVSFTLGSSIGAGYLGIASHNLFSSGCTITLQEYSGGSWNDVTEVTPQDNSIIFIIFKYTISDQWRLSVDGDTEPSIGVLFLGDVIRFDSGIIPSYTPMYMAEDIELLTSRTVTGQFMPNRIQRKGLSTSFSLNILDRDFIEGSDFQSFRRYYNDGGPFFFMSNPKELREDVSYCWRQDGGELQPTFQENGIFYKTSLSLEGFID